MKKLLSLVLAAVLCLSLVPVAMADATVEIDFWCNFGGESYYVPMAEKFMAENPNVKITVMEVPFWDYGTKLDPSLVAGTAADIFMNSTSYYKNYAQQGFIVPIDEQLAASKYWNADERLSSAVENAKLNDKTWCVQYVCATSMLFYNKDMFTAAGLDPEQPPKTWDEVLEYAEKLTIFDENGNITQLGYHPLYTAAANPDMYLANYGVTLMDGETVAFNTEAGVKCFADMLKYNDIIPYDSFVAFREIANAEYSTTNLNYFEAGKVAMLVASNDQGPLMISKDLNLNIGVTLIPTGGENTTNVCFSDGMAYMFTDHGDPARLQAAVDFAAFMTQYEGAKAYSATFNTLMSNNQAREEFMAAQTDVLCDNYWNVVEEAMKTTRMKDVVPAYPGWGDKLSSAWNLMYQGELTPEQALQQAQDDIELEIENYHIFND